jgi:hypothetical protein
MENKTFEPYLFYKEYPFIKSLLLQLKDLSSVAVVAGGCPRDIYLDLPFSDIDIYVSHECHFVDATNLLCSMPEVSNVNLQVGDRLPPQYKAEHITAVISFEAKGLPFQLVVTNRRTFDSILDTFAVNLSKFYFEDKNIKYTETAGRDLYKQKITVNGKVHVNRHYIKKIAKKFPTFEVINENESSLPF